MLDIVQNRIENSLIKRGSHPRALGYQKPKNFDHVEKYPLRAFSGAVPRVPIQMGINWYSNFDTPVPVKFGSLTRYFVGRVPNLGTIRGGHALCIKSGNYSDRLAWWDFYDQGNEGACVGFSGSRMMTLLNRERYNARWLWDTAKLIDEWGDTNPGDDNGTSVHAAADVLMSKGHVKWVNLMANFDTNNDYQGRDALSSDTSKGISAARWATSVDDIRSVLQSSLNDQLEAVPFLNSWGRYYPHVTWMPYTVIERLINEDGEFLVPTDR